MLSFAGHACFLINSCRSSLTSSSVHTSAKPVAKELTDICSLAVFRCVDSCLHFLKCLRFLVDPFYPCESCIVFLTRRRQKGAECCRDSLVTAFCQGRDRFVILLGVLFLNVMSSARFCLAILSMSFFELLDHGVHVCRFGYVDSCF